ncbi:MAG: tRNA (adenosine(37)-N6)-threonylcarbamoyltransferase complex dimerization subunit type 1 TsaB [Eubacteriales bacterium]|nr:tRNA (adenosine(37)-N6)-threonylcarbamoyltransferase complex dimerization subunit type 1 TsaB [Eubacteriales bacterium]
MNILAVDSCSMVATCAVVCGGKLVSEGYVNHSRTHSQKLLPMIDNVIKSAEMTVAEIDLFVCTVGPGSFTGQRIGISTIKGLAQGLNKPCVGVSALESMAYNIPFTDGIICPIMDARRGQVYNGLYKWEDGKLIIVEADRALALDDLLEELKGKKVIFMGDGVPVFKDKLGDFLVAPPHLSQIRGGSVAMLGMEKEPVSYDNLLPLYLRKSQAEREYDEKNK